jgi:hypothetical protein
MIYNNKLMILSFKEEIIHKYYSDIVNFIIDHPPSSFNTHLCVGFPMTRVPISIFHCKENNSNTKLMAGNTNVS